MPSLPPLRYWLPLFDPDTEHWSTLARLLRWLTIAWAIFGLMVLLSASYAVAESDLGDGLYYVKRQAVWLFVALIVFNVLNYTSLRQLIGVAPWCCLGFLGLILLTLLPGLGTEINGATRWLYIGPIPLQPSELIKPFLILQGAWVFSQWSQLRWSTRFLWLGIFGCVMGSILLQPNLSTAGLTGILLWLIALAAGLPYSQLVGTACAGLMTAVISISHNEYQLRRILSFLDPWKESRGDGYQLTQSLMAIGSGGNWGTGYGLSHQKLFYLPIQHTDFIFAVFAEEFGFGGSLCLLLFLGLYSALGLAIALRTSRKIHQLIAMGAVILLVGQSLINIGVATGALPTTGLPLPLFSYGGNSMISSFLTAALLIRVARESSEGDIITLADDRRAARRRRIAQ
ncbi:MAG: FtsW/RodA/SpoVE family cell cycle protein [Prochlorotrichaceae cyanobacterium]|jgi:cell division protein FtsW